jgi:four helix bundle protein
METTELRRYGDASRLTQPDLPCVMDSVEDTELLEWEKRQREAITGDPLWRLLVYRQSMFLIELSRGDVRASAQTVAESPRSEQLLRAVGSIAANIAEGYGRPTTADRVRFFTYALGSVREAIAWYEALRPLSDSAFIDDRTDRLARVRRMLLGLLSRLRAKGGRKFDSW